MAGPAERAVRVIAVSGSVAAGKTTLARALADGLGGHRISTRDLVVAHACRSGLAVPANRRALQEYGAALDEATHGAWVAEAAAVVLATRPDVALLVVDAVRLPAQVAGLRDAFGPGVTHVHLDAPCDVLASRYAARGERSGLSELSSYAEVAAHAVESVVRGLGSEADIVVDTSHRTAAEVRERVAAAMDL
jgi:adenylosuccinate synthase